MMTFLFDSKKKLNCSGILKYRETWKKNIESRRRDSDIGYLNEKKIYW